GSASACPTSSQTDCAPFACVAGACLTSCATIADCVPGHRCSGTQCVPAAGLGNPCRGPADCLSGICAGGVCCDRACDGPCERCDSPGDLGRCQPRPAGDPGSPRCRAP